MRAEDISTVIMTIVIGIICQIISHNTALSIGFALYTLILGIVMDYIVKRYQHEVLARVPQATVIAFRWALGIVFGIISGIAAILVLLLITILGITTIPIENMCGIILIAALMPVLISDSKYILEETLKEFQE